MSGIPNFDLPLIQENANGWGPPVSDADSPSTRFIGMPFQTFNKCDRVGRIVDWLGIDRYKKERYNERMYGFSPNAGLQFDYVHDNEDSFQLVGTAKQQKPQRMFRKNTQPFRKIAQKDIERREIQYYNQSNKMKRSIAKEQVELSLACLLFVEFRCAPINCGNVGVEFVLDSPLGMLHVVMGIDKETRIECPLFRFVQTGRFSWSLISNA